MQSFDRSERPEPLVMIDASARVDVPWSGVEAGTIHHWGGVTGDLRLDDQVELWRYR
jgi:hypothetical protein